ncbi:hypothetical protein AMTR_s00174p00057060 [Amborella trichopoda]|uniref:Uncharacterized protein n=1 Tax=Amborella trichopoda TaxID=13333 RepID=U5D2A0_AMBTC|nr:hypothetical protein AMTR_s00174p00057060 [Amborella trichopoda]
MERRRQIIDANLWERRPIRFSRHLECRNVNNVTDAQEERCKGNNQRTAVGTMGFVPSESALEPLGCCCLYVGPSSTQRL